ncbi:MAG: cold shock domain-containing protein [Acidimicrobiales bacterium]
MSRGRIVEFDEEKGTGHVESLDGRRLFFHCTAIADGSRTIEVGADVAFTAKASHMGQWEATAIETLPLRR